MHFTSNQIDHQTNGKSVMKSIDNLGCNMAEQYTSDSTLEETTILGHLKSLRNVIIQMKTIYLTPYFVTQGINVAYTFGIFPTFMHALFPTNEEIMIKISYGFLCYGLGCFLGSWFWGKLYDFCKEKLGVLMGIHVFLVCGSYSALALSMTNMEMTIIAKEHFLMVIVFLFVIFITLEILKF